MNSDPVARRGREEVYTEMGTRRREQVLGQVGAALASHVSPRGNRTTSAWILMQVGRQVQAGSTVPGTVKEALEG